MSCHQDIEDQGHVKRRNDISSFFVTMLIGLAYQEMIPPVRESVRESGISFGTFVLVSVFFLTSIRFFIGNQLHLQSEGLVGMPGMVWFYDLSCIIIQSVILIFLGGYTTVRENQVSAIGFVELLMALYVVDILWIASQWILARMLKRWERDDDIPWNWGILNAALVVFTLAIGPLIRDWYSGAGLVVLFVLNLAAFVADVVVVVISGNLDRPRRRRPAQSVPSDSQG